MFLTLANLLIDAAHIAEERAHLLGAEPGATGLERHLDAVGHDQMTPDLDRARAPWSRWQRPGRRLLQHFTDSVQGQPRQLPFANQQELLDMALGVIGPLADPLRAIDQALLDVVADVPPRQLGESGDLVEGEFLGALTSYLYANSGGE